MYLKQVKNLMPYFLNENNNDIYVGFVPDNIYIYSTGTIYIYIQPGQYIYTRTGQYIYIQPVFK